MIRFDNDVLALETGDELEADRRGPLRYGSTMYNAYRVRGFDFLILIEQGELT